MHFCNFSEVKMKIKDLREQKGLTQLELSQELGVQRSAIAKWETGRTFPRTELLLKLAQILNCTVDELLQGEKKTPPQGELEVKYD